mmetsp:Transcript_6584/g.13710  ORF Transcript_6584/g.13710 Transcript_6584/m.13710 type:complete len:223 (-) Transcript_6584:487-1155(-)
MVHSSVSDQPFDLLDPANRRRGPARFDAHCGRVPSAQTLNEALNALSGILAVRKCAHGSCFSWARHPLVDYSRDCVLINWRGRAEPRQSNGESPAEGGCVTFQFQAVYRLHLGVDETSKPPHSRSPVTILNGSHAHRADQVGVGAMGVVQVVACDRKLWHVSSVESLTHAQERHGPHETTDVGVIHASRDLDTLHAFHALQGHRHLVRCRTERDSGGHIRGA